jgi:MFS family permease
MKTIIKKFPHILLFGVFQIFFSAPGQTFLIATYVSSIFSELEVSQSLFAGIYSAATLSAALLLNPAGRLIDRYPAHKVVMAITCFMAIGCWVLASAQNIPLIFLGFFILRLIGQGVFSLTASTLMVKQFHKNRGKAMGFVTLGFPLSEAVYPYMALFLLSLVGWRISYVIFGISNLVIMLPLQLFLLRRANIKQGHFLPGEIDVNPQHLRGNPEQRNPHSYKNFRAGEALKDIKFYLILAASCLPPMVVTGLFFHQESLFARNDWAISYAASGLMVYAVVKAWGSVWIGGIVDKYGPMLPFAVLILLMGLGTLLASLGGSTFIIYLYYALIGAALGFSSPVSNVVWPHFYGTKYMGSIKGMVATARNGVTAFGPLPIAMALDAGIGMNLILFWMAIGIIVMAVLPYIVTLLDRYKIGIQYSN